MYRQSTCLHIGEYLFRNMSNRKTDPSWVSTANIVLEWQDLNIGDNLWMSWGLKVKKLCHLFAFKLTKQYQKPNSLWSNSGLDFSAFYKQDKAFYFWLRQELKESKIKMSVRSSVRLVQVWSSSFWVAQVSLSSISWFSYLYLTYSTDGAWLVVMNSE